MNGTARAAVFEAPNAPFVLHEFPLKDADAGEVLVRIRMSTICRSDIHSWEGKRHNPCPGILGHEIIGSIAEIGDGVGADMRGEALNVGDRITWTEFFFCGECYFCRVLNLPQKCVGLRKYGHDASDVPPHLLGGFAEYCYVQPGTGILRLPEDLSDEEAAVSTRGSTIPAPKISIQPELEQTPQPFPSQNGQVISTSADGSVNGK